MSKFTRSELIAACHFTSISYGLVGKPAGKTFPYQVSSLRVVISL